MILLLGGTQDARAVASKLKEANVGFIYSVQSDYAAELVQEDEFQIQTGGLDESELEDFINKNHIDTVVDATHPYAKQISKNAMKACENCLKDYIRFEREESLGKEEDVLFFEDQQSAADYLSTKKGKIFLTTGSRELEVWNVIERDRLVVRVLPTSKILEKCEKLGLKPYQIIAQQGPFNYEENALAIKRFGALYLVTKDGGNIAKTLDKISAAKDTGATAIIIKKPQMHYSKSTNNIKTLLEWIENG